MIATRPTFRSVLLTATALAALLLLPAAPGPVHAQAWGDEPTEAAAPPVAAPQVPSHKVHANHEHPAVIAWREAQLHPGRMDPNQMRVQPPASVTWTVLPDDAALPVHRTAQR